LDGDKTDLHYGDIFGSEAGIFCYELDGSTTLSAEAGLTRGRVGAPESVQILAWRRRRTPEVTTQARGSATTCENKDLMGMPRLWMARPRGKSRQRRYGS